MQTIKIFIILTQKIFDKIQHLFAIFENCNKLERKGISLTWAQVSVKL